LNQAEKVLLLEFLSSRIPPQNRDHLSQHDLKFVWCTPFVAEKICQRPCACFSICSIFCKRG